MNRIIGLILTVFVSCSSAFGALTALDGMVAAIRPVDFKADYADVHRAIDAAGHDSTANVIFGAFSGHVAIGQGGQFSHNQDLAKDSTTSASTLSSTNLTWGFKRGRVRIFYDTGSVMTDVSAGTVTLGDTVLNFIEFNIDSMAVQVRQTRFTETYWPMYQVRRDTGRVVGETDVRTWATAINQTVITAASVTYATNKVDSGFANFILHDFDKDTGRTVGLTLVFRRGKFRSYAYDTTFDTGVDSVSLSASNTNFVGIDAHGNIITTTTRMPDTVYPLRTARTSATAIIQDTDERSPAATFMGDAKTYVGLDTEKDVFRNLRRGRDFYWATNTETFYVALTSSTWKNVSLAGVQTTPSRAQYDSIASFRVNVTTTLSTLVICTGPAGTSVPWDSGISTTYFGSVRYLDGSRVSSSIIIRDGLTGLDKHTPVYSGGEAAALGDSRPFSITVPWTRRDTIVTSSSTTSNLDFDFNIFSLHHP